MRKKALISAVAIAALATIVPMSWADAAPKPKLDLLGQGTYVLEADGSATLTGSVEGRPIDGSYTAVLAADDGTLPAPGACEAGTLTFELQGGKKRALELVAPGDLCGHEPDPSAVYTQLFEGTYEVVGGSRKALNGTDGFVEVRLLEDGGATFFAIDT